VKWVHYAMLNAEELGVGQKNIDEAMSSATPDVKRLVGAITASSSALPRTGRCASSSTWAIMVKCSSATSARDRR
jgi:hypothetical protein